MACYLCQQNSKEIDFRNTELLNRYVSKSGKIRSRKKTGLCAKHQKKITRAIKHARFLMLI